MKFLWPSALLLLGLIPLLIAGYIWMQRRRRRYSVRFSSLSLVRAALPRHSWLRRYLPAALFLLALAALVLGLARPAAVTVIPAGRATIILTLDVSRSMRQNDIPPSRLGAAKAAALSFIQRQNESNQIGIVAFAGISQLVRPPTDDADELEAAILQLTTGRGTAIGSGILTALETIRAFGQGAGEGAGLPAAGPTGTYQPDIIVLLTDGVYTTGPDPLEAAQEAVKQGIRVYTIGYGTATGAQDRGNDPFGGRFYRGIDEASLRQIAEMTGGEYYTASSADELQRVFDGLPTALITREETTEISFGFAAFAALVASLAFVLSQLWRPLP